MREELDLHTQRQIADGVQVAPTANRANRRRCLTIIKTSHMPKLFSMARGSTNGFRCGDEIWFVVHFVHQWQNEPRFYYHAVAIFDGEMEYKKCTYPFKFSDKPIEYCLGLVVEDDRIIFGRSVYDKDAALKIVHKKTFLDKYLME